jgi:hypothetical protein
LVEVCPAAGRKTDARRLAREVRGEAMSEVTKSYSTKEKSMTTTGHGSRGALTFLTVPLVLLVACLLSPSAARAQWTTSGNNISNTNTGNVGVGTAAPEESLHVLGNIRVGFAPTTLTKINAAGGVNATDTTLTVLSTASYPSSGTLLLDREAVTYTGKTATTFTGLTRGMFGTTAVAHADQTEVDAYLLNVQVQSSARPKFVVTGKGHVGIGRHAPAASLHVAHSGDLAPIAYDANGHGQGLLFNQYTVIADGWRRYTDIAALGSQDGNAGGSTIRFITNPINTPTAFERMRIDRDGNVGIGTASPAHKLEVAGSSSRNTLALTGDGDAAGYAGIRIQAQTTTGIPTNRTSAFVLSMRKDAWYGGDGSGPSFIIETTSKTGGFAAPFLITPNNNVILNGGQGASGLSYGNVGVGTVNPTQKLDVAGNVNASGLCLGGTCKSTWAEITGTASQWTNSGSNIYFSTGSVGIGTASPNEALTVNGKITSNRAASPGPAEFRVYNGGSIAEWAFRQAGSASHNLNISKAVGATYTDYLTIDTAGRVGIGTNAPGYSLDVVGGAQWAARFKKTDATHGGILVESAAGYNPNVALSVGGAVKWYMNSNVAAGDALQFWEATGATPRLTITQAGSVGVGTAAPIRGFQVSGPNGSGNSEFVLENTGMPANNRKLNLWGSSSLGTAGRFFIRLLNDAGTAATREFMSFDNASGNVGVGTVNPTQKLDVAGNVNAAGLCLGGTCKSTWAEISGTSSQWTNSGSNIYFSTGSVGVGTSTPGARLDVGAGAPARGTYTDLLVGAGGNNAQLEFYGPTKSTAVAHDEALGGLVFHMNGPAFAHSLFLHNGGNVGVGTTAPAQKLHVFGGNVFHQFSATAGSEYGFYTSINNNHFTSNVYFDGQWRMMTAGKGAFISTAPLGGNAFSVYADNTSRAAGAAASFTQYMVVTMDGNVGVGNNAPAHKLDVAGSVNASGLCLGGACKSNWAEISGSGSQWANSGSNIHFGSGSVGIGSGAANPAELLELNGPGEVKVRAAGTISAGIQFRETNGTLTWSEWQQYSDRLRLNTHEGATTRADVMSVLPDGRVGVGTAAPATRLHVAGDITVDGNITAKYQDLAEWVPSVQKLRAGTVVVLDAERTNHVLASGKAYDTKVAGVVSEMPGIILGVGGDDKVKVATTGRVRVRVDATRGGILVGDLLVTSGVEGVAMKSIPVDLGGTPIHRPGTIIGKALEPLKGGVGEILVLLSLQ